MRYILLILCDYCIDIRLFQVFKPISFYLMNCKMKCKLLPLKHLSNECNNMKKNNQITLLWVTISRARRMQSFNSILKMKVNSYSTKMVNQQDFFWFTQSSRLSFYNITVDFHDQRGIIKPVLKHILDTITSGAGHKFWRLGQQIQLTLKDQNIAQKVILLRSVTIIRVRCGCFSL